MGRAAYAISAAAIASKADDKSLSSFSFPDASINASLPANLREQFRRLRVEQPHGSTGAASAGGGYNFASCPAARRMLKGVPASFSPRRAFVILPQQFRGLHDGHHPDACPLHVQELFRESAHPPKLPGSPGGFQ